MPIITTIEHKCKACYSCIRNCPAKAIQVIDGQAKVIPERCVSCGSCVKVCSQKAKQVHSHLPDVVARIHADANQEIIAMIAPSCLVSFPDIQPDQLHQGLLNVGFTQVYPVTYGVDLTIPLYQELIENTTHTVISSYCPAIVGLIEKHFPSLIPNLAPIDSAVLALARYLRTKYREPYIVFIGPCVAKKEEARHENSQSLVDAVITFRELKQILADHDIDLSKLTPERENLETLAQLFPVSGGLLRNLKMVGMDFQWENAMVEGQEDSVTVLKQLAEGTINPRFLDILFCKGCIDGPEIDSPLDWWSRKKLLLTHTRLSENASKPKLPVLDHSRKFISRLQTLPQPSEADIQAILAHTYKSKHEDELNCGACGYQTCREKASAVYWGFADLDMCFPYLLHKSRGEIEYYKNRLENLTAPKYSLDAIVGNSVAISQIKEILPRAAQSESTILILGESGVGKEVFAQALHNLSPRRAGPFIAINCAALPELLLESELFGYDEGAFTGARKGGKPGKFELANGGTILLDEIGDMPLTMQAKLLRVLQERELERVGGTRSIKLDIRVIAATNADLKSAVLNGKFRHDLYYRLNVISLFIPPLRQRMEDIPLLVDFIIHKLSREKHLTPKIFSAAAMACLSAYDWPGNVRELENMVERALYITDAQMVLDTHLPSHLQINSDHNSQEDLPQLKDAVRQLEKSLIIQALQKTDNNRQAAAQLLGLPRATFYQRLKEFELL